jgi:hypothetical protein
MQGLIDTAVVVVAVIVPSLCLQFGPKASHGGSLKIATGVGHEANIGIPLQAYYKRRPGRRMAACVPSLQEN